jgi:hypothetical protein
MTITPMIPRMRSTQTPIALAAAVLVLAPLAATAQQPRTLPAPDATFDEPFTLVSLGTLRELGDGRVLVADTRDKVVQLIDLRSGNAVSVGREGSGPGEYALPMRVLGGPADTTFIFDPGNQRYLVVAPDGRPVTTFRMELPTSGGPGGPGGMRMGLSIARATDARGRLYYEGSPMPSGPGQQAPDTVAVMRYDRGTQRVDTLGWVKLAPNNMQVTGSQGNMNVRIGMANPLAPRDEWTVFPDGRVAIVRAANYQVDWVLANGTRRSSAPIRFTPLRVTEADKKEEEAMRARAMQGAVMMTVEAGPGGTRRSASVGPQRGATPTPITDWPAVKPPFRSGMTSVLARPNGELWVRRTEAAGAKGTLYDVIDAQGAVTHSVRVPAGLTVVGFGNGTVYTTRLDEDDLVYLQRHRLQDR